MGLVQEADRMKNELSNEILRAVVANHAYLEDFLRTLALTFLPIADEKALDGIPLAGGQFERAEKFSLGKLTRHRGKTVNDLIKESVSAYMERSTFNSVTETMSFLESIGLKLASKKDENSPLVPPFDPAMLPVLEKMMRRRHHIVHRADKDKTGEGLQTITAGEVVAGMAITMLFMFCVSHAAFMKRHSFDEFKRQVDEFRAAAGKISGPQAQKG